MTRDNDPIYTKEISTGVYKFQIFDKLLYVYTLSDHLEYIQEYIDSVISGNPDKNAVIRRFAIENTKIPKDSIDRILLQNPNAIQIVSDLDKIEKDLKPIFEAMERDKKIDDLLN